MSKTTSPYSHPHFPQEFTHHALSRPLDSAAPHTGALLIVTDSGPLPEPKTYEFPSVSDALGNFERVQYEARYGNRSAWRAEPDGVHFHNILVLDTEDPAAPKPVVRSARVVTPDGEWTDKVAHLWVTDGVPKWITTRGDYADEAQPVISYEFS